MCACACAGREREGCIYGQDKIFLGEFQVTLKTLIGDDEVCVRMHIVVVHWN